MPALDFAVSGVRPMEDMAVPTLAFRISVRRTGGGHVRSVSLNTAVRIAVARRRYDTADRLVMARLFGQPEQWATSMRPLTWARVTTVIPPFDNETEFDLPVPCTRDSELAVTSYFHGVRDGEVPLELLFSGTVFHDGPDGRLRTAQISWDKEATCRMTAGLWQEVLGRYGSGTSWVPLSSEAHDALIAHRNRHALSGWDETVADLLARAQHTAGVPAERDEQDQPDFARGAAWTP